MATIKKILKSAPRMRGVTPVPNGPLVKKDGSTLKKGGTVKKAQSGITATADSSAYFKKKADSLNTSAGLKYLKGDFKGGKKDSNKSIKALYDEYRQSEKGRPGKDANGFPINKQRSGGKIKKAKVGAWQRKEGKNPTGGLNAKGVASYRRENPGSKLKMAVTTPPSKLKPGSKSAKRRKSFCARMSGVSGPMKKPNGKPTRKALALRKWNC